MNHNAVRTLRVRTLKGTHFTGAIAQNVGVQVTLAAGIPNGWPKTGQNGVNSRLKSIRILSKENLAWEVWLFADSNFATTNADTENFLGFWSFVAADGKQATIGVTLDTYWHYYIDGLDISIKDALNLQQLYLRLVNRSAASKSAGAAGEMVVELVIEPA